jgi:hypothetical protein
MRSHPGSTFEQRLAEQKARFERKAAPAKTWAKAG